MYYLADTGVLLRYMEPSDPDHPVIAKAIDDVLVNGDEVVFSPQNASEFWAVCTRPKTSRGLGLSVAETNRRLAILERDFPMLFDDQGSYAEWRRLVHAHSVKGKQVHDAKLVALMKSNGITHIMTLNGADFARYPGITIIDPTQP